VGCLPQPPISRLNLYFLTEPGICAIAGLVRI